jgi:hypothetical protein
LIACTTTSLGKKHFPDPFKHIKHGRVNYLMDYNAEGAPVYHRDITGPCGYGILIFKVAPASKSLPYSFNVYDDKFYFRNDFCPLKPTRKISHVSDHSFILPGDPTLVTAKFNYLTRMSSLVIKPPVDAKEIDADTVAAYGGDYVVVARGPFYDDARVYRQVMDIVHNWTDVNANVPLMDHAELFLKEE